VRRFLLFSAGLFFGLVAEALLWGGPRWYTSDGRIAGLGFIALGAGFVAWAACCLSRAFVALCPPSAQNKIPLSGPASSTVRGRSGLLICAMLFFLGALSAFGQAWNDWHLGQIIGLSEDIAEDALQALAFAVLYVVVGGALLAAPIFLKPGRWQLDWRMKWPGWGIAMLSLLLCGMSLLIWFGNRMGGEGRSEALNLWSSLGIFGGGVLAAIGSVMAMVEMSSHSAGGEDKPSRG
jgi:hypothetical protein